MKQINFGKASIPDGWGIFKLENDKYKGIHNSSTPFSTTDEFDDRFECRKFIIDIQDKNLQQYNQQLDLRFKAVYLPILTMQLMSFYSSDVEYMEGFKHKSKEYQSLLKKSMTNYLTIVESECSQLGVTNMVDFLCDKFNDEVFPILKEIEGILRIKMSQEKRLDELCKVILCSLLGQTIRERNKIFGLRVEKSLDNIIYSCEKLTMFLFSGSFDIDLNQEEISNMVVKLIEVMSKFDLKGFISQYDKNNQ